MAAGHHGTSFDYGRRAFASLCLFAVIVWCLSGCSTARKDEVGSYPGWLITVAEPAAPAIGAVISKVQWRDGYLAADADALAFVAPTLRPLDILLFSNKHRLSGHTGSGLFGHSAVYLGSESELRALGLWSHPAVVPHQDAIRAGRLIIESAQAHGTVLSPVKHAIETDRLVIVRPQVNAARRSAALALLFSHVGAPFDHHYRLDEADHVFCTELIDLALPDLALPRRPTYGREVILPDDIALRAIAGRNMRFVSYLKADRKGWKVASAADLDTDIQMASEKD